MMFCYSHGLTVLQPYFHDTAFVLWARFASIHITQVHLDARDVIAAVSQCMLDNVFKLGGPMIVDMDVVICTDLYLQRYPLDDCNNWLACTIVPKAVLSVNCS